MTLFVTVSDDRSGRKDGKYSESQDRVYSIFKAQPEFGINTFNFWKWDDIVKTDFYRQNKTMLDHPDPDMNGRCYKPFVILEGLKSLDNGDFLIYNDISHEVWGEYKHIDPNLFGLWVIENLCIANGGILSSAARYDTIYEHTHENFTLERCMTKMGLQQHRYDLQHASGMLVFQKSQRSIEFVEEWLHWNLIDECASLGSVDQEKLTNLNPKDTAAALNGYVKLRSPFNYWNAEVKAGLGKIGHRHDQSISGLLINKIGNKLVKETEDYNFLHFCRRNKQYEFIDSHQPPLPYKLKMRHDMEDNTDGVIDRVPR